MTSKLQEKLITGVLALVVLAAPVAALDAEKAERLVSFKSAGTSAMWIAKPGAGATLLSIKSGDIRIEERFRAGVSPVVSLSRPDGTMLPDGQYLWEVSESFAGVNDRVWDAENGRNLARNEKGRSRVPVKGLVQQGAFTVKGGLIVDSTLREPKVR